MSTDRQRGGGRVPGDSPGPHLAVDRLPGFGGDVPACSPEPAIAVAAGGHVTTDCPRCVRGTWTDSNGIGRRCTFCRGTNTAPVPDPAPLLSVGIDVSTRKIAVAAIDEHGAHTLDALPVAAARGARRLLDIRAITRAALAERYGLACAVVVEIPWAGKSSSFALLSTAGVVMEAAQRALPDAVVLDLPTGTWKLATVGKGNASKEQVMEYAHAALGYGGADQDLADALCMAACGWKRWRAATNRAAA